MTPSDVIDPAAESQARAWRAVDIALALVSAGVIAWGVLVGGWSLFAVMALFWLENVVIGAFNLVRILFAGALGGLLAFIGALLMGAFFTVHYGLFTAVHGVFVAMLFGREAGIGMDGGLSGPLGRMFGWLLVDHETVIAIVAIVALHAAALVRWIMQRVAGEAASENLMAAPYGRIMVLHVALIVGAFLMFSLKLPQAAVLLLVALKLLYDLKVAMTPDWKPGSRKRRARVVEEGFRGRP